MKTLLVLVGSMLLVAGLAFAQAVKTAKVVSVDGDNVTVQIAGHKFENGHTLKWEKDGVAKVKSTAHVLKVDGEKVILSIKNHALKAGDGIKLEAEKIKDEVKSKM